LLHAVEKERIPVSVAMQIANQEIENLEKIYAVEFFVSNVLEKAFENSVKAIEARNSTAKAARAAGAS
jgi:hypothetical protein